jgi:alpha-tubulin suppressor-like RCC1 family protein
VADRLHAMKHALSILVAVWLTGCLRAQVDVRAWGGFQVLNTEVFRMPGRSVVASSAEQCSLVLGTDGRLLGFGENWNQQSSPPSGNSYVRVEASPVPLAQLSDGSLVQWSAFTSGPNPPLPPPALPSGLQWTSFAATRFRGFAVRSDGQLISWGLATGGLDQVPVLASGLFYTRVRASQYFAVARVSDGTLRLWGFLPPGLQNVPTLPPGVGFVDMRLGWGHIVALRSDGMVEAWGDNSYGQCNVPALPSGVSYTDIGAGGGHSLARRDDGRWVAWGYDAQDQCQIPFAGANPFVCMSGGSRHTLALRANGQVEAWGEYETPGAVEVATRYRELASMQAGCLAVGSDGELYDILSSNILPPAPVLAPGRRYRSCAFGADYGMALVDDGTLRAWGGQNLYGQLNIPPLPTGTGYTAVAVGSQTVVALRSDGTAVAWGDDSWGQGSVPALPAGVVYTAVAAGQQNVLLLRSDGEIAATGATFAGMTNVPTPPPGVVYTGVACGLRIAAALRSDGAAVSWGSVTATPPPLPAGVSYVEVRCGSQHVVARRSDGEVVTWGAPIVLTPIPDPGRGRSFLRVAATLDSSAALVGPRSSMVSIGGGCGGVGVRRLIPRDTPQIGRTMEFGARSLPLDVAVVLYGLKPIEPAIDLVGIGMPGCLLGVDPVMVEVLTGANGEAVGQLAVPYELELLGADISLQALVPDPAANNAWSAVLSEALAGVVGG